MKIALINKYLVQYFEEIKRSFRNLHKQTTRSKVNRVSKRKLQESRTKLYASSTTSIFTLSAFGQSFSTWFTRASRLRQPFYVIIQSISRPGLIVSSGVSVGSTVSPRYL